MVLLSTYSWNSSPKEYNSNSGSYKFSGLTNLPYIYPINVKFLFTLPPTLKEDIISALNNLLEI